MRAPRARVASGPERARRGDVAARAGHVCGQPADRGAPRAIDDECPDCRIAVARAVVGGVSTRCAADRRGHRPFCTVFPDRSVPRATLARHRGGGGLQRRVPAGGSAAAVSSRRARGRPAVALPRAGRASAGPRLARRDGVRRDRDAGSLDDRRVDDPTALRRALRGGRPGVSRPRPVVSIVVAQLRVDPPTHWLGPPARVRRVVRGGARRERRAEHAAHSRAVDRWRRVGHVVDGSLPDRGMRARSVGRRRAARTGRR